MITTKEFFKLADETNIEHAAMSIRLLDLKDRWLRSMVLGYRKATIKLHRAMADQAGATRYNYQHRVYPYDPPQRDSEGSGGSG
jgi:hypothetical protein